MVPIAWPVVWWVGRALATQKGREVVAAGILAVATVTTVAINSDKFPTIDLPVRRDGTSSNVQLNPMMLNSNKKTDNSGDSKKSQEPKIKIDEKDKIDRDLLNPPKKPGDAPTFKKDGTSAEIHHEGQNPDGPYKEMHKNDHRGGENYRKNHPAGQTPLTKEQRRQFNKDRPQYWKAEFPEIKE
ncbi:HNH/ENDO VII family nuclease [Sphingobacterium anhuiense]|uniref:HNH/ENDO VII family nuclease n=1 Tax=Sphingobacterium anhuiense TaxID=493780 RepID=UPI003C304F0E